MRKPFTIGTVVIISALLVGCAGAFLWVAQLLALGIVAGQVTDFFGRDSTDFNVVIDGYDLGIHPNPSGALNLDGLPTGDHLISVIASDLRVGWHSTVTIQQNVPVDLGQITPIQGAIISGKVAREVGTSQAPLEGALIAAVKGGAALLAQVGGSQMSFPPPSTLTAILTYSDAQGNFRLGPCEFGDWLVTAAYPGLLADATLCSVQSGVDAGGQNLLLEPNAAALTPATVRGSVLVQVETRGHLSGQGRHNTHTGTRDQGAQGKDHEANPSCRGTERGLHVTFTGGLFRENANRPPLYAQCAGRRRELEDCRQQVRAWHDLPGHLQQSVESRVSISCRKQEVYRLDESACAAQGRAARRLLFLPSTYGIHRPDSAFQDTF